MKEVFADTFYWIALTDPREQYHALAVTLRHQWSRTRVVTSEGVLTEYLAFFAGQGRVPRENAVLNAEGILNDPKIHVESQSSVRFRNALELYKNRLDKGYSLVDCMSTQLMWERNITAVLTYDRHFLQEGFQLLFD